MTRPNTPNRRRPVVNAPYARVTRHLVGVPCGTKGARYTTPHAVQVTCKRCRATAAEGRRAADGA